MLTLRSVSLRSMHPFGDQLANSNEMSKAEKYFKHCLKLNPTSIPVHFGLGKNRENTVFDRFSVVLSGFWPYVTRDIYV